MSVCIRECFQTAVTMVAWNSLNNEHAGSLPGGPETPLGMSVCVCVVVGGAGGHGHQLLPGNPSPTMIYDLSGSRKSPAAAGAAVVLLASPKGAVMLLRMRRHVHSLRARLPQQLLQTRITQLPSCRLLRNFCCSITSPEFLKGSVSVGKHMVGKNQRKSSILR